MAVQISLDQRVDALRDELVEKNYEVLKEAARKGAEGDSEAATEIHG